MLNYFTKQFNAINHGLAILFMKSVKWVGIMLLVKRVIWVLTISTMRIKNYIEWFFKHVRLYVLASSKVLMFKSSLFSTIVLPYEMIKFVKIVCPKYTSVACTMTIVFM